MKFEPAKSVLLGNGETVLVDEAKCTFMDNRDARTHLAILDLFSKEVTPGTPSEDIPEPEDVVTLTHIGRREIMLWQGDNYTNMGDWTEDDEDEQILTML